LGEQPQLIIENCEEKLSDWLWAEYSHCAAIWPGLVFTNVKDERMRYHLSKLGRVSSRDALSYTGGKGCIILDHQAEKPLRKEEMSEAKYLIVGGILGYDKPLGRTKKYITDRFNMKFNAARHMGPTQLTIDSAVFVARAILLGARLEEIEITKELEVKWDEVHSTILPYGYPVVGGKVIFTPGLLDVLAAQYRST
jgi:ribosome biogenesis SPOUT family RNA methylase Rps3